MEVREPSGRCLPARRRRPRKKNRDLRAKQTKREREDKGESCVYQGEGEGRGRRAKGHLRKVLGGRQKGARRRRSLRAAKRTEVTSKKNRLSREKKEKRRI